MTSWGNHFFQKVAAESHSWRRDSLGSVLVDMGPPGFADCSAELGRVRKAKQSQKIYHRGHGDRREEDTETETERKGINAEVAEVRRESGELGEGAGKLGKENTQPHKARVGHPAPSEDRPLHGSGPKRKVGRKVGWVGAG
jgi:hypothetical protein